MATAIALSAGVASAKGTPAPKQLNQATGDKVVAILEATLPGTGWGLGLKPLPKDGQVQNYPADINGDGKPESYTAFDQQHARTRMFMHRTQPTTSGNLNIFVDVLGFANPKNAKAAALGANNTTPTGTFTTAAGKVAYTTSTYQGAVTGGGTATINENSTIYAPANNFLVEVQATLTSDATRTDSLSVMETVSTALVKYLKTGATQ